jgi:hypothetical protein
MRVVGLVKRIVGAENQNGGRPESIFSRNCQAVSSCSQDF